MHSANICPSLTHTRALGRNKDVQWPTCGQHSQLETIMSADLFMNHGHIANTSAGRFVYVYPFDINCLDPLKSNGARIWSVL